MTLDIEETRRICNAATPGPWWNESGVIHAKDRNWTPDSHSCCHPLAEHNGEGEDADFACHARTTLPEALDEIEALRASLGDGWLAELVRGRLILNARKAHDAAEKAREKA